MQEIDLPPLAPSVYEIPERPKDAKPKTVLVLDDDPALPKR